jgi:hypothetical protein
MKNIFGLVQNILAGIMVGTVGQVPVGQLVPRTSCWHGPLDCPRLVDDPKH